MITRLKAWLVSLIKFPPIQIKVEVDAYSRQHFNADGSSKINYVNVEAAERASVAMAKRTGLKFNAYKCRICSGYHVGKAH